MNERSCDDDDLLEPLDKVWTEDHVICDSIPYNVRVRGQFPSLVLGFVTLPVDHRKRSALEEVDVPVCS